MLNKIKFAIFGCVAVLVILSIKSDTNPFGLSILNQTRVYTTFYALIGAAGVYGLCLVAGKLLSSNARKVVGIGLVLLLGIIAFLQAAPQLSSLGFAARNRNPDYAAVGLAYIGAALAVWQSVEVGGHRELPRKLTISLLVFLNIYLFFAAW